MATQQTNISLGYGIRRTPSLGDDGELSEAMNLIPRGGELVNIQPPTSIGINLSSGEVLLAVHETRVYTHYIVASSKATSHSGLLSGNMFYLPTEVIDVVSIGNTLSVSYEGGVEYYLWKSDKYIHLGSKPEPIHYRGNDRVSFFTSASYAAETDELTEVMGIDLDSYNAVKNDDRAVVYVKEENKQDVKDSVMSIVNRMRARLYKEGKILFPCFVRMAYRLYDQTHIMPTPPRLICPNSIGKPLILLNTATKGSKEVVITDVVMPYIKSYYTLKIPTGWEDIITAIDVYVSQPMQAYYDDGEFNLTEIRKITEEYVDAFANGLYATGFSTTETNILNNYMNAGYWTTVQKNTPSSSDFYEVYNQKSTSPDGVKYTHIYFNTKARPNAYAVAYFRTASGQYNTQNFKSVSPADAIGMGLPVDENYKIYDVRYNEYGQAIEYQDPVSTDPSGARVTIAVYNPKGVNVMCAKQESADTLSSVILPLGNKDEDYMKEVTSAASFYLADTISLKDHKDEDYIDYTIKFNEYFLSSITGRKTEDLGEFRSADVIKSKGQFSYNQRLNLIVDEERMAEVPYDEMCYQDYSGMGNVKEIVFCANVNGNDYAVKVSKFDANDPTSLNAFDEDVAFECMPYLFYPNSNVNSAYLKVYYSNTALTKWYKVDMTAHLTQEGSYCFNNFKSIKEVAVEVGPGDVPTTLSPNIKYGNKIYTSEVNNPFVFKATGINTLDCKEVFGVSTATKALSQGQFGEFPLYAFCNNGIWALTVSNTGTYSSKQPISRDVVSNPDSITQIDNAVVFVTEQGLKMVSGSEVTNLSEKVEGVNVDEDFFSEDIDARLLSRETSQFSEVVKNAKIVYDDAHYLLHIFTTQNDHYVLDLRSLEFSKQMLDAALVAAVPGYPNSTLQLGRQLRQYKKLTNSTIREGFILTRSVSFGNPLSKKALYDLRTIGQRVSKDTKFSVVVYISDNNVTWTKLNSLKARSAKYYRFLIKTSMTDLETLSGISLQFQERYTNKMR